MCSKKYCSIKCRLITIGIIGAILIAFGGALMFIFDEIYETVLKKQMAVVPGTLMYNLNWKEVKTPVFRSFYLFNVTNKEEFLNQTPGQFVKPILQEIGPYTYREHLSKDRVEYFDYNKSHPQQAYYRQKALFYFDEERSMGREDDIVTTLNFIIPLIPSLLEYLLEPGPVLAAGYAYFNELVENTNSELLFTMTVGEYLFGFQDPLLSAIIDFISPGAESDIFGLFMLTNTSRFWRNYKVYTGVQNYELTNVITEYNNMSELPYWFGPTCNMINGTDGTMTPPFMDITKPTYFFVDEMCRSLHAVYEKDATVLNIKGWKYTVPPEVFYSPLRNKENECFCEDLSHEVCQHDGALLLGPCLFNTPLMASFPHFLYGDGFYLSKLEGLNPNKEDHEMTLVYEPTTGLVIDAASRIQLSLYMTPHKRVTILQQIQESFAFPMIWLNENAVLQESEAEWVYLLLYRIDDLVLLLQIIIIVIGAILLAGSIIYPLYKRHKRSPKFNKKIKHPPAVRYNSTSDDVFSDKVMSSEDISHDNRLVSTTSTTVLVSS